MSLELMKYNAVGQLVKEGTPKITEVIDSDVTGDDLQRSSWVNLKSPCGQLFNFGEFRKIIASEQPGGATLASKLNLQYLLETPRRVIIFSVFNASKQGELLGKCLLETTDLINLNDQAREFSMILLNDL